MFPAPRPGFAGMQISTSSNADHGPHSKNVRHSLCVTPLLQPGEDAVQEPTLVQAVKAFQLHTEIV